MLCGQHVWWITLHDDHTWSDSIHRRGLQIYRYMMNMIHRMYVLIFLNKSISLPVVFEKLEGKSVHMQLYWHKYTVQDIRTRLKAQDIHYKIKSPLLRSIHSTHAPSNKFQSRGCWRIDFKRGTFFLHLDIGMPKLYQAVLFWLNIKNDCSLTGSLWSIKWTVLDAVQGNLSL